MLARIVEFVTWVKQWQGAPREDSVGKRLGYDCERYVATEPRPLGRMLDDVRG
jgi:hypothetical protein